MILKKVLCFLFGHKFKLYAVAVDVCEDGITWLKCKRCNKDFLLSHRTETLSPMENEFIFRHQWQLSTHPNSICYVAINNSSKPITAGTLVTFDGESIEQYEMNERKAVSDEKRNNNRN